MWGLGLGSLGFLIWFADKSVGLGVVFEEVKRDESWLVAVVVMVRRMRMGWMYD